MMTVMVMIQLSLFFACGDTFDPISPLLATWRLNFLAFFVYLLLVHTAASLYFVARNPLLLSLLFIASNLVCAF